jgi:hypothetical protein
MIEKVRFVVRLNNASFRPFLYRVIMDRSPAKVTKLPLYRWFDTVISYDISAIAARYLANATGFYVPESTGLEKLRLNFRGGNSYLSRLNASAKFTWYFKRPETADEFEARLGPFLNGLSVGLSSETPVPAAEPEITLGKSITSLDLNPFRTMHRWLFELLMPCELAQRAFTESYQLGRSGVTTFITNLYIESIQHLKRCDSDSCVQFAFDNEALERSLHILNKKLT